MYDDGICGVFVGVVRCVVADGVAVVMVCCVVIE